MPLHRSVHESEKQNSVYDEVISMKTESEIIAMLEKCDEVAVGHELEIEIDGHMNYFNFWTDLGVFESGLRWVLDKKR